MLLLLLRMVAIALGVACGARNLAAVAAALGRRSLLVLTWARVGTPGRIVLHRLLVLSKWRRCVSRLAVRIRVAEVVGRVAVVGITLGGVRLLGHRSCSSDGSSLGLLVLLHAGTASKAREAVLSAVHAGHPVLSGEGCAVSWLLLRSLRRRGG